MTPFGGADRANAGNGGTCPDAVTADLGRRRRSRRSTPIARPPTATCEGPPPSRRRLAAKLRRLPDGTDAGAAARYHRKAAWRRPCAVRSR
jgi:hypothetical protein